MLRAEGIVKRYKRRTVVNGVSVEVAQGEIVGLLHCVFLQNQSPPRVGVSRINCPLS